MQLPVFCWNWSIFVSSIPIGAKDISRPSTPHQRQNSILLYVDYLGQYYNYDHDYDYSYCYHTVESTFIPECRSITKAQCHPKTQVIRQRPLVLLRKHSTGLMFRLLQAAMNKSNSMGKRHTEHLAMCCSYNVN